MQPQDVRLGKFVFCNHHRASEPLVVVVNRICEKDGENYVDVACHEFCSWVKCDDVYATADEAKAAREANRRALLHKELENSDDILKFLLEKGMIDLTAVDNNTAIVVMDRLREVGAV